MNKRFFVIIASIVLISGTFGITADSSGKDTYLESLKSKELLFGYFSDAQYYKESNNSESGLLMPIVDYFRSELGLNVTMRKYDLSNGIKALSENEIDIFGTLTTTETQKNSFNYSEPVSSSKIGIITRVNKPIGNISNLRNCKIGVYSNTAALSRIKYYTGETQNVTVFETIEELLTALDSGEIDAALATRPTQDEILTFPTIVYEHWLDNFVEDNVIAVNRDSELTELINILNDYIRSRNEEFLEKAGNAKIDAVCAKLRNYLSTEIKELGEKYSGGIKILSADNLYPLSYSEKGELKGISAEIFDIFECITGIPVIISENDDFTTGTSMIDALHNGLLDAVCSFHFIRDTDYNVIYSDSIVDDKLVYVYLRDKKSPPSEMKQPVVGVLNSVRGYFSSDVRPNFIPVYYDDEETMFQVLHEGGLDAVIVSGMFLNYEYIIGDKYDYMGDATYTTVAPITYLYNAGNAELKTVIDHCIRTIKAFEHEQFSTLTNNRLMFQDAYDANMLITESQFFAFRISLAVVFLLFASIIVYLILVERYNYSIWGFLRSQNSINVYTIDIAKKRYVSKNGFSIFTKHGIPIKKNSISFEEFEGYLDNQIHEQYVNAIVDMIDNGKDLTYIDIETAYEGNPIYFRDYIFRVNRRKLFCCTIDNTDEISAQKEMRNRLAIALKISGAGTWEVNCKGKLVVFDEHYAALMDIKRPSPMSLIEYEDYMASLMPQYSFNKVEQIITGKAAPERHKIVFADGTERYILSYTHVIDGFDNNPERVVGLTTDVTEEYNSELKLIEALERAKQASEFKSRFLAHMSHEIRTPMNAIIGMTEMGIKSNSVEKKQYSLTKIGIASNTLLGIINQILDMSKIEAGKLELKNNVFDLHKMLSDLVTLHSHNLQQGYHNLILNIGSDTPTMVYGDEQSITQVLANLLSNAVKFTPPNGDITLTVDKQRQEGNDVWIKFMVKDSGIGVPPEKYEVLFNAFEQADSGDARRYGGTGLGLAISKNLVNMMGGDIKVESESGKGATFFFELKLQLSIMGAKHGKANKSGEKKAKIIPPDLTGKTVLIAEDVEINLEIIENILQCTNISVESAENGRVAYEKFKGAPGKYDIIFMDIQMPEMDGYDTTKAIREIGSEKAKNIPIIAMTASAFKDEKEKCFEVGMNAHIAKPLNSGEVIRTLKEYFEKKQ